MLVMWPVMHAGKPSPCEQIDRCKNITFPQLRFRAVIIIQVNENCFKSVTNIFVSGVRPVHNASETVRVHFGLSLIEILNFNTESGLLRAKVWERYVRLHSFFCSYSDSGHIKYFSSQPLSNSTKLLDIYSYGKILSWNRTHRITMVWTLYVSVPTKSGNLTWSFITGTYFLKA